jgi:hypothetical protein
VSAKAKAFTAGVTGKAKAFTAMTHQAVLLPMELAVTSRSARNTSFYFGFEVPPLNQQT